MASLAEKRKADIEERSANPEVRPEELRLLEALLFASAEPIDQAGHPTDAALGERDLEVGPTLERAAPEQVLRAERGDLGGEDHQVDPPHHPHQQGKSAAKTLRRPGAGEQHIVGPRRAAGNQGKPRQGQ